MDSYILRKNAVYKTIQKSIRVIKLNDIGVRSRYPGHGSVITSQSIITYPYPRYLLLVFKSSYVHKHSQGIQQLMHFYTTDHIAHFGDRGYFRVDITDHEKFDWIALKVTGLVECHIFTQKSINLTRNRSKFVAPVNDIQFAINRNTTLICIYFFKKTWLAILD